MLNGGKSQSPAVMDLRKTFLTFLRSFTWLAHFANSRRRILDVNENVQPVFSCIFAGNR